MKTAWSNEEDDLLLDLQARLGSKWGAVCRHIPGRTASQCAQRWRHKQALAAKGVEWRSDDERQLADLVAAHGKRWVVIAAQLPSRSAQQCMDRWRAMQADSEAKIKAQQVQSSGWGASEDASLAAWVRRLGHAWTSISKHVRKTPQQCRSRWTQLAAAKERGGLGGKGQDLSAEQQIKALRGRPKQASAPAKKAAARGKGQASIQRAGGAKKGAAAAAAEPCSSSSLLSDMMTSSTGSMDMSTCSSSLQADWPPEDKGGAKAARTAASPPARRRSGGSRQPQQQQQAGGRSVAAAATAAVATQQNRGRAPASAAAASAKGVFVCGRRRIFFSTRPRTTVYKRRSSTSGMQPHAAAANSKQARPAVAEDDEAPTAAPAAQQHPAPSSAAVPPCKPAGLLLPFASPPSCLPIAASSSHLHSVQTGLHVKRLPLDACLDSCRPEARAAALLLGARTGPPSAVPGSNQGAEPGEGAGKGSSLLEGLGESSAPAAAAVWAPPPPQAQPPPLLLSGGAQPSPAAEGEGLAMQGTPRSRMCTPRTGSRGSKQQVASPASQSPGVGDRHQRRSLDQVGDSPAGPPRGVPRRASQDVLLAAGRPSASPGGGRAQPGRPSEHVRRASHSDAAATAGGSPSFSQAVSDWSNVASASWSSWQRKGYAVTILGADAESLPDHDAAIARPFSRPAALARPSTAAAAAPSTADCSAGDSLRPWAGSSGAAAAAAALPSEGVARRLHAEDMDFAAAVAAANPGPADADERLEGSGDPCVSREHASGAGGSRQRRASDPYPGSQNETHARPDGSPMKKVCLNSPQQQQQQQQQQQASSPGPQRQPGVPGLSLLGRAAGNRTGYRSLMSILDAPSESLQPASGRSRQQSPLTGPRPANGPALARAASSPTAVPGAELPPPSPPQALPSAPSAAEPGRACLSLSASLAQAFIAQQHRQDVSGAASAVPQQAGVGATAAPPRPPDVPANPLPYPPMAPPPLNAAAAQAFRSRRLGAALQQGPPLELLARVASDP